MEWWLSKGIRTFGKAFFLVVHSLSGHHFFESNQVWRTDGTVTLKWPFWTSDLLDKSFGTDSSQPVIGLSVLSFIWKLYIKDHFSYLDETFFNFPRMGFEQNRINRSVFLLRSIQIQDIHFEINPKMNMPPFKYYPMSAKKSIRWNVKTVNVNFIIRFRRFF